LKNLNINSSFGEIKIYLDNTKLKNKKANINIKSEFSGIEIYIPKEWKVINNVQYTFGGSDEKGYNSVVKSEETIIINGKVTFSGVTIIYI